jgi:two-component system phosphate regulon response regulator PhoB
MKIPILIVEDEPAIQELVAVNLEHAGYMPLRAGTVPEAQAHLRDALPDMILLDWMLPGVSGLDFARQLRADTRTRDIPIIMLTARALEQDKVTGLELGADDYITKPFSPRELLARIKSVMRRRAPQLTDDLVVVSGIVLNPVAHEVTAKDITLELGPTEFRILHFFMTHPDRVYNRRQLLDFIWGDHVFIEERTVDVHIRRLRQALDAARLAHLIETVRSAGYRFRTVG